MYAINFTSFTNNGKSETLLAPRFLNLLDAWMGLMVVISNRGSDAPTACSSYNHVIYTYPSHRNLNVRIQGENGEYEFNAPCGQCRFREYGPTGNEYVYDIINPETGEAFFDCHLVA